MATPQYNKFVYLHQWVPSPSRARINEVGAKPIAQVIILCEIGKHLHTEVKTRLFSSLNTEFIFVQDEQDEQFFLKVLHCIQGKIEQNITTNITVVCSNSDYHKYGFVSGLLKSVNKETSIITGKVLGLDEATNHDDQFILSELLTEDTEVRYVNGKREVKELKEVNEASLSTDTLTIRKGGVYLITGGTGGLGLIFAKHLTQIDDIKLILTGRSELTKEKKKVINELSGTTYRKCDVTQFGEVETLIQEIEVEHGKLNGVIHAAGVATASVVVNKTQEEVMNILPPKIIGTRNIDHATQEKDLDFMVFFSSISAVLGDIGLADYASANAYLDNYATYRKSLVQKGKRFGKTIAIDWAFWENGGMSIDDESRIFLESQWGMVPLPNEEGTKAFDLLLRSSVEQGLVIYGNRDKIKESLASKEQEVKVTRSTKLNYEKQEELKGLSTTFFKKLFADEIGVQESNIELYIPLQEYGIESVMIIKLTNRLSSIFGKIPSTLFFEYQSIGELIDYFIEKQSTQLIEILDIGDSRGNKKESSKNRTIQRIKTTSKKGSVSSKLKEKELSYTKEEDIAIVGLSGRYPGAKSINQFWQNLKEGKDCVTEIPKERWDVDTFFHKEKGKKGKSYSKWGGFVDDIDKFDPLFFNISPREAELLDPQERLFLETVWETIEDAGYTREQLHKSNSNNSLGKDVGVYVGVTLEEYQLLGVEEQRKGNFVTPWGVISSIANRVSYFFDFHGPSMAVDTMCSSSISAIQLACRSILNGDCQSAIAGGVNLSMHPNKYLFLSENSFVSSKGKCESFGANGDGYVPSEGVGAILLKPLSKAKEDGDQIYGVIKGVAVNHGGRTNGFTVPNLKAQAAVIKDVIQKSGIFPKDFSYIEAHGTGTSLGDPIEIAGLTKAFQSEEKQYCSIGSVKSNIGHCESAAGISGITKVLLQLKYKQLVPSLHSKELNSKIDFEESPFKVQQELEPWNVKEGTPRLAGISSFGAGGSNSHIIIQEYIPASIDKIKNNEPVAIIVSAKNVKRLREYVLKLHSFLEEHSSVELLDVAYTLQVGREAMEERLAFVANDKNSVIEQLEAYLKGQSIGISANIKNESRNLSEKDISENLISKAFFEKDLETLIELWTKGGNIDWTLLYENNTPPQKVSLPTYPFARDRYWLTNENSNQSNSVYQSLHPLVHFNTSSLQEQCFTSTYKGTEPFLNDHKVKGEKILPGVAYLEIAREAGEQSILKKITKISDVAWLSPIRVNDNPKTIKVQLFEEEYTVDYEVTDSGDEVGENEVIHSRGKLSTAKIDKPNSKDINEIKSGLSKTLSHAECYQVFDRIGLNYGPEFAGIDELYYSEEEALSKLKLPINASFVLQPGILDSALQTCIGLNLNDEGNVNLPFSVKEVAIHGDVSETTWCYARKSERNKEGSKITYFNVDLLNESGEVVLQFEDFATIPIQGFQIPTVNQEKPLSEDRLHLFKQDWKIEGANNAIKSSNQVILLAGGTADIADKLTALLEVEVESINENTEIGYYLSIQNKVQSVLKQKESTQFVVMYNNKDFVDYGFIQGVLKTATLESPKFKGKTIGVDNLSIHDIERLENLIKIELEDASTEVRYLSGRREVRRVNEVRIGQSLSSPIFKQHGVYLITGGAGGIGQIMAKSIVQSATNAQIILIGRSEQCKLSLSELQNINATYISCDVIQKKDVEKLISQIVEEYGQLNGVIHSAGVIRDSFLLNKTEQESEAVLTTKILGAKNIDQLTQDQPLDFMMFFGSIAGIRGNVGQGDYASANVWLDNYADYRNSLINEGKRRGHTISIDWPLWKEGGMQIDPETIQFFEQKWGMKSLPTSQGVEAMKILLSQKMKQGIVTYGENISCDILNDKIKTEEVIEHNESEESPKEILSQIENKLKSIIGDLIKVPVDDLDLDVDFSEYGIESIVMMKILNKIEASFQITAEPTAIVSYPNIAELATYIHDDTEYLKTIVKEPKIEIPENISEPKVVQPSKKRRHTKEPLKRDKVAIIGMSCQVAGSDNLEEFWDNLKLGKNLITDVPEQRWNALDYFSLNGEKDKTYSTKGGFMKNAGVFDAAFFGLTDDEAITMDPQQRIVLELSRALFAHAGYQKEELSNSNTSIYIGARDNNYVKDHYHQLPEKTYQHTVVNIIGNMIAARVSDYYNLKGSSQVVDTACSSSLVAIHQAAEDILQGNSEMSIAGGISVMVDPFSHISFSQAQVLSKNDKSYVFDERAQGFVLGEGGGLVLLKSLEKAKADGDRIYGIISGSAVNNDGKTMGLTVPNKEGQKAVIDQALSIAKVSPSEVTYYEAHGTGTLLGDPIEVKAATEVFRLRTTDGDRKQYCAVGSVKSNIGHTMTSAGVSGVIKIALQLLHKSIAPTLNCDKPHPRFRFEESPFYPNTQLKTWEKPVTGTRKAAISSFGFGGTNCHLIIEEEEGTDNVIKRSHQSIQFIAPKYYWLGQPIESLYQSSKTIEHGVEMNHVYKYDEPYLKDHIVNNNQVVLGVTYASLMIDKLKSSSAGVSLKSILFKDPVILQKGNEVTVLIDDTLVEKAMVSAIKEDGTNTQVAECKVSTYSEEAIDISDVISEIQHNANKVIFKDDFYSFEKRENVWHGASLKIIEQVWVHNQKALSLIRLDKSLLPEHHYQNVHPAILNAGLMTGIALLSGNEGSYLPLMIKQLNVLDTIEDDCFVLAKLVKSNREVLEFDYQICNPQGQVKVKVKGFVCKRVNSPTKEIQNNENTIKSLQTPILKTTNSVKQVVEAFLREQLSRLIKGDIQKVQSNRNFMDMGVDSVQLIELVKQIEMKLGEELYPTLFFEYQNINELSAFLAEEFPNAFQQPKATSKLESNNEEEGHLEVELKEEIKNEVNEQSPIESNVKPLVFTTPNITQTPENEKDPIAIVGMHGVFPGAQNSEEFWGHLQDKSDLIKDIPSDHFDYEPWYDPTPGIEDKMYCKKGSFIDDVDKFDADFFNISPREAQIMDPQLRYLLQVLYGTAEDAGSINTIRGTNTGLYVGVCFQDYMQEMKQQGVKVNAHEGTGNAATMLANRPSFYFNLTGPSLSIDTACSSSLIALHTAAKAIENGDCDQAFVAGANLLLSSQHYRYFSSIQALSASGRSHSFDNRADGYIPGESVAAVLLKPLSKAKEDGDHIYGVIKGGAISHGGYTPSITAPSVDGEVNVLVKAWENAGINPETLGYIETHGTGTKLGDPIEINALKKAFKKSAVNLNSSSRIAVGSAKAHVGHTEGAAGIVGVIKALLSINKKRIPAMPKFEKLNDYIKLEGSPFFINSEVVNWQSLNQQPRRAGISSFGFGGSYAHIVIEEYSKEKPQPFDSNEPAIIIVSAKNQEQLAVQAQNIKKFVQSNTSSNLYDIAYTLQIGREPMQERLAFITFSNEELVTEINNYLEGKTGNYFIGKSTSELSEKDEQIIEGAILTRQSRTIAEFWAKGSTVDWKGLYDQNKPSKISLPTYAFSKDSYWFTAQLGTEKEEVNTIHPLLHCNSSNLAEQKFKSTYSGSEFFLKDHKLHNDKVLPGVAHLELVRMAGLKSIEQPVTQIKDITWMSPIKVNNSPEEIEVNVFHVGNEIGFEVHSSIDGNEQVHSQGKFTTQEIQQPQKIDINEIKNQLTQSTDRASFYKSLQNIGLNLGPAFQGIETIWYNDSVALSKINLQKEKDFMLLPGVLDSAIQTCFGLRLTGGLEGLWIPYKVREFNIYDILPEVSWSYARKSDNNKVGETIFKYDVDLLNDQGEVLASFRDFIALPLNGLSEQVKEEQLASHYFKNEWLISSEIVSQTINDSQLVLVAGGSEALSEMIREELEIESYTLSSGTQEDYFLRVLEIVKDKIKNKSSVNITLLCENATYVEFGFLSGLLKSAKKENSIITGKVVSVESLSPHHISSIVEVLEKEQGSIDTEVRYLDDRRETKVISSILPEADINDFSIKAEGVYIITGGFGGLGQKFAQHISKFSNTKIILTGRSELSREKEVLLKEWGATYYACDVSLKSDVYSLIQFVKEKYGIVDGVIHAAGVIRDSIILNKTKEEALAVLSAKIRGTKNLDEATKDENLDFMIFFSSISGVLGNVGQADYASANAYLDNFADYREEKRRNGERKGKTISINWPLWKDGGMHITPETERMITKQSGMVSLPTVHGIEAFDKIVKSNFSQAIIIFGYGKKIAQTLQGKTNESNKAKKVDSSELEKQVKSKLSLLVAEVLEQSISKITEDREFGEYGFDSVLFTQFGNKLNKAYSLELMPTVFYNYPSIQLLAEHFVEEYPYEMDKEHSTSAVAKEVSAEVELNPFDAKQRSRFSGLQKVNKVHDSETKKLKNIDVAIVGVSGRFPGSPDLPTFWENLKNNKDLITEVPYFRWDWKAFYGDPIKEKKKTKAKWGGFIRDIDKFDPLFFNMSPREAELMDPQQRIMLETVYRALEDAGIARKKIKGSNTGVFIGVASSDYSTLLSEKTDLTGEAQYPTGTAHSVLVNRISYLLDIHGPSEPIDAACSSSLIAIHRAVENIKNGHCDMAIAGGVNAILSPDLTLAFSQAGMLSDDGRCKTFDQKANGYVRGEGVGAIVLKSLSQAEKDGDNIYGVIKGTAENHGGKANTLTSPNPIAQKNLLLKAYRTSGVDPRKVSYIEAHGTGTPLGDPIEIEGLKLAFKELYKDWGLDNSEQPYCGIGSVKTNIGHLEAAAGIAGVMKVILSLKHKMLPGNVHLENPNKYLDFNRSPFFLQQETTPWNSINDSSRVAGISSFGFGGANSHIIIEEYQSNQSSSFTNDAPSIVLLSAKNEERLREQVSNLKMFISTNENVTLHDIAFTLQLGRDTMEERLAFVVGNMRELMEELNHFLSGGVGSFFKGNVEKDDVGFLLEGNAGKAYIREALKEKESKSLAQLWVKGVNMDWELLYEGARPSKISLPTYPFSRETYWFETQEKQKGLGIDKLHPLLHCNESNLQEQKFKSVYTGKEFFLADHKLHADMVLPGVAHIELIRAAGNISAQQEITKILDIRWLNPIRVDKDPEEVFVNMFPNDSEVGFEVYSLQGGEKSKHSQGKVTTVVQSIPQKTDIEAIKQKLPDVTDRNTFYEALRGVGLNLGTAFRGVEKIWYSDSVALSKISLPQEEGYKFLPGMLDSAIQTCYGLRLKEGITGLWIPYNIKEITLFKELPSVAWSYTRKSKSNKEGETVFKYDVDLLNEQGETLVSFRDFTALPMNGLSDQIPTEKPSTNYFTNNWSDTSAVFKQKISDAQLVLIAGEDEPLTVKLRETLDMEVVEIISSNEDEFFCEVLKKVKEITQQKTSINISVVCQNDEYVDYGFVSGLLKSAHHEHAKITGKIIGVDALTLSEADNIAEILNKEKDSAHAEVRYINGVREVKELKKAELSVGRKNIHIKEGGTYLITGGFGELGKVFSQHIHEIANTKLILTGRSVLSEAKKDTLELLGASYYSCDVSNKSEVLSLIKDVKKSHGQLDGVIHGAGVIRDSLINQKTQEEASIVLSAKINGIKNIDEATKDEDLDFMVLFSSISAILGNVGQADYASANAYLDNFASYRHNKMQTGERKGKTISINWPLWKEGGMHIDAETEQSIAKRSGMLSLPTQEGLVAFDTLLNSSEERGMVMYGYAHKISNKLFPKKKTESNKESSHVDKQTLQDQVVEKLLSLLSKLLKLDKDNISSTEELGKYGFDSILLTKYSNELNEYYDLDLMPTVFYNYPTVELLAENLVEDFESEMVKQHAQNTQEKSKDESPLKEEESIKARFEFIQNEKNELVNKTKSTEGIAIIGISGRFPQSPNLAAYWNNLKNNKDLITEVPSSRWDWKDYYGDPDEKINTTKSIWGGFIDEIDKFDPLFFSISPREAELMDPQQRVMLESVYSAIDNAGISAEEVKGTNTGVFIGVASSDYSILIRDNTNLMGQAQYPTGTSHSVLVNRISYLLDLHGPSEPIDTACSSSLIAIHRAVENIRNGHCDMAIAGGVNALLSPELTLAFSQAGMLSEDGRCKTFDQSANGYVRGEGVGTVLLKSLSKAEADGDPIYGVIRGTAENHGGRANTLTSPNPNAQKDLLVKAYSAAGIDPRDISYIEAHGTGTPLGDPIEIEGLKLAFKELYKKQDLTFSGEPYCAVGSVKTNIGHLEAAAGIAGVAKVVMAMKHQTIPGNVHLKSPNEYLKLDKSPFFLQDKTTPWKSEKPRIAGISSFGFGGANSHIIIEEYQAKTKPAYASKFPAIILLSAKNKIALKQQAVNLNEYIQGNTDTNIFDVAYSLQVGREHMVERVAFVANSMDVLYSKLEAYISNEFEEVISGNVKKNTTYSKLDKSTKASYVDEAFKNEDMNRVAELWVNGISIEWKLLYGNKVPSKLNLPSYPFARDRYWISMKGETSSFQQDVGVSSIQPISTLLDNGKEHNIRKVFSGKESFLVDHVVNNEKILPGVAYLELAREMGSQHLPTKVTKLKDVTWLQPVRVNGSPKEIQVCLNKENDELEYKIISAYSNTKEVTHAKGILSSAALGTPPVIELDTIKARLSDEKKGIECYSIFKTLGLNYGTSFQGINTLYYNENECLSRISLAKEEQFVLQPGILDSALQTCIGLSFGKNGSLNLPFSTREINIYGDVSHTAWCYVKKSNQHGEESKVAIFDIDLISTEGETVLSFRDFVALPSKKTQTSKVPSEDLLYKPIWKKALLSKNLGSNEENEITWVVGGQSPFTDQLVGLLEAQGKNVTVSQSVDQCPSQVSAVYLLQGLEVQKPQVQVMNSIKSQEYTVFNCLKKLQSIGKGNLKITALTIGTQLVFDNETVNENGAGIIGLIGSVAKEELNWEVRVIDVENQSFSTIEELLQIPYSDSGELYALRNRKVYAQSLIPMDNPFPNHRGSKLRKAGVYVIVGGAGGLGQVTTEYLIKEYDANVYWLGRRPKDGKIEEGIQKMSHYGKEPVYIQCDTTDKQSVENAYFEIKKVEDSVNGLFHSAIVLNDMALANMSLDEFKKAFDPKAISSSNFVEIFREENLDFICFYSSIQSYFSAPMQGNYAAGCTYKDSFARRIEQKYDIPSYTIHWGYWGDVGIVSSPEYAKRMEQMGVGSIQSEEGMEALTKLLSGSERQFSVMKFTNKEILKSLTLIDTGKISKQQEAVSNIQLENISL